MKLYKLIESTHNQYRQLIGESWEPAHPMVFDPKFISWDYFLDPHYEYYEKNKGTEGHENYIPPEIDCEDETFKCIKIADIKNTITDDGYVIEDNDSIAYYEYELFELEPEEIKNRLTEDEALEHLMDNNITIWTMNELKERFEELIRYNDTWDENIKDLFFTIYNNEDTKFFYIPYEDYLDIQPIDDIVDFLIEY